MIDMETLRADVARAMAAEPPRIVKVEPPPPGLGPTAYRSLSNEERERIQASAAIATVLEAVKADALALQQEFLSPQYAANQPAGSFCERFAIGQLIQRIEQAAAAARGEGGK